MRREERATSGNGIVLRRTLVDALLIGMAVALTVGAVGRVDAAMYESAPMGVPGREGGVSVGTQLVGSRFRVDTTVVVGSVGGHLGRSTGTIFGAIVALDGRFPAGPPLDESQVLASTVFDAGFPSSDVMVPLSVTLPPGDYALVFGSFLFGAFGTSFMPANNGGDVQGASYFFSSAGAGHWLDETHGRLRFVVDGEPCAECATPDGTATPVSPAGTPGPVTATPVVATGTGGASVAATPVPRTATSGPPAKTPAAPTATPAPAAETAVAPSATPAERTDGDPPTATAIPSAPNGTAVAGATPASTSVPSPRGTPITELPLLRKPVRKCQSALAAQARSFAQAFHAAVQRCFDRMLKDLADGKGTLAAGRDCATVLAPSSPASKISRRRSKALAQIARRCTGILPNDIGAPCDASASTIDEIAECIIESYTLRVSEEVADTYHDSCQLLATADLPEVFAGVCSSED